MDIYFIFPEINPYLYRKDWIMMMMLMMLMMMISLKREWMLKTITLLFCTNHTE